MLKINGKCCLTQVGFNGDLLGSVNKFVAVPALNDRNQHQRWLWTSPLKTDLVLERKCLSWCELRRHILGFMTHLHSMCLPAALWLNGNCSAGSSTHFLFKMKSNKCILKKLHNADATGVWDQSTSSYLINWVEHHRQQCTSRWWRVCQVTLEGNEPLFISPDASKRRPSLLLVPSLLQHLGNVLMFKLSVIERML